MISTSLNHCKEMGAEPGRRFLKQTAAKLKPVNVGSSNVTMWCASCVFIPFLKFLRFFLSVHYLGIL